MRPRGACPEGLLIKQTPCGSVKQPRPVQEAAIHCAQALSVAKAGCQAISSKYPPQRRSRRPQKRNVQVGPANSGAVHGQAGKTNGQKVMALRGASGTKTNALKLTIQQALVCFYSAKLCSVKTKRGFENQAVVDAGNQSAGPNQLRRQVIAHPVAAKALLARH